MICLQLGRTKGKTSLQEQDLFVQTTHSHNLLVALLVACCHLVMVVLMLSVVPVLLL